MLASPPGTRLVYEPANVADGIITGQEAALTELPRTDSPATGDVLRAMSGRLRSPWTDQMNHSHLPRRSVVKDVRAMWLLGAVRAQRPHVPIIILTRHPYDIARSVVDLGWCDPTRSAADNFAAEVATWCDAYENALDARALWVAYEDLRADPRAQLSRIRAFATHFHPTWEALDVETIDVERWSQTNFRQTTSSSATTPIDAAWIDAATPRLAASPWSAYYGTDGSVVGHLADVIAGDFSWN